MWLEHENRSGLGHRKTLTDKVRKVGRGLWCLEDHVIVCPKVDSQAVLWYKSGEVVNVEERFGKEHSEAEAISIYLVHTLSTMLPL